MPSPRFREALRLLILLSFSAVTLLGTSACSASRDLRISQIPIRQELRQCAALVPTQPEQRQAIAPNPDFNGFAAVLGALPGAPVILALQQAAGDHARRIQFQERAAGDMRDIAQAAVIRENCEKLAEVVSLVDANNAGPEE